jgi:hypothetical protein
MKTKNLIVLTAILVVLIAITFAYRQLTKQKLSSEMPYAGLDKDTFFKIEITKKDGKHVFQKGAEQWDIIDPISYPADQRVMDTIIEKVIELEVGEIISTLKEKQAAFEVDEASRGIHVKIYQKDEETPAVSFILGKSAFDYLHYYFRYPGSNEIKVCKGPTRSLVDRQLKDWRDKTILSLEKNKIERISLIYPEETVELTKKEEKWIIGDAQKGIEADSTKVNPILDALSNLKTNDFVEKEKRGNLKEFGLVKPEFQVVVKTAEQEEKILAGKKNNEKCYVKKENRDTVFLINSYKIDNLKKKRNDLKKAEENK